MTAPGHQGRATARGHQGRATIRLGLIGGGLPMDEAVLTPEANARTVLTLSHEQVRRPINKASVARWKNYEWAFGAEWDRLVGIHEARRKK